MIQHFLNALPIVSEDTNFSFLKKEIDFLENTTYKNTHVINGSSDNCGVRVSKEENILKNKEMKRIKNFILKKIEEYKNNILQINNKLKLTQSWSTCNEKGNFHHLHNHPNTFISLVYYVKCSEQGGDIVFELPKSRLQEGFNFNYSITNYNSYNSTTWKIITKLNKLIIFPGWLQHHTTPHETDDKRIVLGANFFLEGVIGEKNNHDLMDISLNENL
jgi:uncharacterized protein (TIGR02466 family)